MDPEKFLTLPAGRSVLLRPNDLDREFKATDELIIACVNGTGRFTPDPTSEPRTGAPHKGFRPDRNGEYRSVTINKYLPKGVPARPHAWRYFPEKLRLSRPIETADNVIGVWEEILFDVLREREQHLPTFVHA